MGYTHYYYYKNPIVDLANKTNALVKDREAHKDFPEHIVYVKRIKKHAAAFQKISSELNGVFKHLPEYSFNAGCDKEYKLELAGGNGIGNPEITPEQIWFNGTESNGMDHETFSLNLFDMSYYNSVDQMGKDGVFNFCKTARKPYDFAVCIALMVIKHHLGADFSISSDGNSKDWQPSIDFYESYFKRKASKQLTNYLTKGYQTA